MKICNFGSLNLDRVYTVSHMAQPGETLASSTMEEFCGGKGLNQSLALARAGATVFHAGCIGADGGRLRELLERSGVDVRFVHQAEGANGHAIIQIDETGQNSIILHGGANREITKSMVDTVLEHFGSGDLLVLQNEINEIPYIIHRAEERHMRIVFNPSPFDEAVTAYPLDKVDYFVVNELEGLRLSGETEPLAIIHALRQMYPKANVLLTLGEKGSLYVQDTAVYRQGIIQSFVRDTTAAGDTFLGFFFSQLERLGPEKALQLASAAAALAVSVKGAANSIPNLRQVEEFFNMRGLSC